MASTPRFTLYIKKAGTCPFSQRAYMFMLLRMPKTQFIVKEIDLQNKPKEFLEINPGGKVPVLVDHTPGSGASPKIVPDSAEIVKYVDANVGQDSPTGFNLCSNYEGEASSYGSLFSLFAKYMTNMDPALEETHKQALLAELEKFDNFLKKQGSKYMLGDHLTEPDCMLQPRLNQIRIVGEQLKAFRIPEKCNAIWKYMEAIKEEEAWKETCPNSEDICSGWKTKIDSLAKSQKA